MMILTNTGRRIGFLLSGAFLPLLLPDLVLAADCTLNGTPFVITDDPTFVANGSSVACSGPGTLTGWISTMDEFEAASITFSDGASLQAGNGYALSIGVMNLLIEQGSTISAGALGETMIRGAGPNVVVNRGTIIGPTAYGAYVDGSPDDFTNAGSVVGNVMLAGGVNRFTLEPGGTISGGTVSGTGTQNTFRLGGSGASNFAVGELGTVYVGFNSFEKAGTAVWTLTGTNAAVTPWTLSAGSLSVAADESLGDVSGALTFNGGTFQVTGTAFTSTPRAVNWGANGGGFDIADPDNTFTVNQSLTGTGGLTKQGAGVLILTGTNTLSGPTSVEAGRLAVNGSLANSAVTVGNGASLSGTGTIGSLVAQNASAIAPGNAIGTLSVAGPVSFMAGSVYQVEVNAAGQSDLITAAGAAILSGGTVATLAEEGTYRAATTYTILSAAGGVTGRFAGVTSNLAFLTPSLSYDSSDVTLTLARTVDPTPPTPPTPPIPPTPPNPPGPPEPTPIAFNSVAVTPNQYATADGVEALGAGNGLFDVVLGSSVSGARLAFDALSGEAHASAVTVGYGDARLVQGAVLNRLRSPGGSALPAFTQGVYGAAYAADLAGVSPQPVAIVVPGFDQNRFAVWGDGFGSWGRTQSNGNAASLDTSTGGFILGADAHLDPAARIGVAGGFTRTSFDIDGRRSSGANESIFAAVYGSGSSGAFNLRLGASYAWHDIDTDRAVFFPGLSDATSASYDGSTLQAFGELGYAFALSRATIEPFVGASALRLRTDGFQENGGVAALTGYRRDHDLATTTLGVRGEMQISLDVPLMVKGLVGWRHAYGDVEPSTLLAFVGGASAFVVSGVPVDRNALVAEAGLTWQASDSVSLGVSYAGQIGKDAHDHSLKGSFLWKFATR